MTARQSSPKARVFSASNCLQELADALTAIKEDDNLTDADMARVLGKCGDQAAKYRTGLAEMGAVSLLSAWREWNGRFIGPIKRFVEDSRPCSVDDRRGHTTILEAALALSVALQDGSITPEEVRANRSTLENARDAIDAQLAKLRPAA